jgi:adenylylsulfate kinase-like enzyme
MNQLPILWLCGAIGVGKSSVGWELFTQVRASGIAAGYADADQLGLCYPPPADDPVNQRIKARNVGAVFKNYHEAGARCLILVGSVYSNEEVALYRNQFPEATLTLCLLHAEARIVRQRFLQRGWAPHLVDQAVAEAIQLDHADFIDLRVDTSTASIVEVAQLVRVQAGNWPGLN